MSLIAVGSYIADARSGIKLAAFLSVLLFLPSCRRPGALDRILDRNPGTAIHIHVHCECAKAK